MGVFQDVEINSSGEVEFFPDQVACCGTDDTGHVVIGSRTVGGSYHHKRITNKIFIIPDPRMWGAYNKIGSRMSEVCKWREV